MFVCIHFRHEAATILFQKNMYKNKMFGIRKFQFREGNHTKMFPFLSNRRPNTSTKRERENEQQYDCVSCFHTHISFILIIISKACFDGSKKAENIVGNWQSFFPMEMQRPKIFHSMVYSRWVNFMSTLFECMKILHPLALMSIVCGQFTSHHFDVRVVKSYREKGKEIEQILTFVWQAWIKVSMDSSNNH